MVFRLLYVCPREVWETKLDRNRFASLEAITRHVERQRGKVVVTGPGWPSWDPKLSPAANVAALGEPWFDLALLYHVDNMVDIPAVRTVTCNEAYEPRHVASYLSNAPDYLVLHHTNETEAFAGRCGALYHLLHCADPAVFYDDDRPKKHDVTLVGFDFWWLYPLRAKLAALFKRGIPGLRVHQHGHPGYAIKDPDAAVREYAEVIRDSKVVATCSSKFFYHLSKFAEIPMCGAVLATDMPKDGASFLRKFAVELNADDSDAELESKLRRAVKEWEARARRGKELTSATATQAHYAARFLNVYDTFCDNHGTARVVRADEIEVRGKFGGTVRHTSADPHFAAIYTAFCRLQDRDLPLVRLHDGRVGFDTFGVLVKDGDAAALLSAAVPELIGAEPVVADSWLVGIKGPLFWSDPRTLVRIPRVNVRVRRVLMVADSDAWCWHYKATSIAKYCNGSVAVDIAYTHAKNPGSTVYADALLDVYDHVHFFGWWAVPERAFELQHHGMLTVSVTLAATPITTMGKDLVPHIGKRAAVVAVSPYLADWCKGNGVGSSVHRCYNGVDTGIFVPPCPGDRHTGPARVLMCNKPLAPNDIDDSHGLLIAEKVKSHLERRGVDVTLHIARATSKNLLNQTQMVELYQAHDVYVFCGRHHLGTPNTAFEAAACGCAVVATANGCLPELVRSAGDRSVGQLVPVPQRRSAGATDRDDNATAQHLSSIVHELCKDAALLAKTQDNARAVVDANWSWRDRAQPYADVFGLRVPGNEITKTAE